MSLESKEKRMAGKRPSAIIFEHGHGARFPARISDGSCGSTDASSSIPASISISSELGSFFDLEIRRRGAKTTGHVAGSSERRYACQGRPNPAAGRGGLSNVQLDWKEGRAREKGALRVIPARGGPMHVCLGIAALPQWHS